MKARSALWKAFPGFRLVNHFILGIDENRGKPLRVRSFLNAATKKLRSGIVDSSNDHVIRIHRDRRIVTMANDNGISKELLIFGRHEPIVTGIVSQSVKKGMTCLDIGSNIGYYVLLEEKLVGEEGLVIAFEPSPKNFNYLKRSIILNHSSKTQAYNVAVGDADGILNIELDRKSNLSRIADSPLGLQVEKVAECKIDTFVSDLDLSKVHFVRMDIEGYEYRALVGAKVTLMRWKPEIVVEVHRELMGVPTTIELLDLLLTLGYEAVCMVPRRWDYPILSRQNCVLNIPLKELIKDLRAGKMAPGSKTFTLYLKPVQLVQLIE